jgi:threonine dehydratase
MCILTNTKSSSYPHDVTLFSLSDLDAATALVRAYVPVTPSYRWPLLQHEVGRDVVVKHENMTPTGAFKVRGGLVFAERLKRERPDVKGIVSATRGNHGISLAYAGRANNIPVVIVVPEGNGVEKNSAMAALGAEVVIHGADFEMARLHSIELGQQRGLEAVPPFHVDLVCGVATYAKELFDDAGPLDAVYVPIGMGSGICGLITVRNLLGLSTKIIGVGADGAPAQANSFAARAVVGTASVKTFVDGVATRQPDPTAAQIIRDGAERVITVSDDATAEAIRMLWRCTHHLAEPAGAISLAGLLADRDQLSTDSRVAMILCGSNIDTDMAAAVLGGATPPA